jgi:hypothetical protein
MKSDWCGAHTIWWKVPFQYSCIILIISIIFIIWFNITNNENNANN